MQNWSSMATPLLHFSEPVSKRSHLSGGLSWSTMILIHLPQFHFAISTMSGKQFFAKLQTHIFNSLLTCCPKFCLSPCDLSNWRIASDSVLNLITLLEIVHANDLIPFSSSCCKYAFMIWTPSHSFDWAEKTLIIKEQRLSMVLLSKTHAIKLSIEHISDAPNCEFGPTCRRS